MPSSYPLAAESIRTLRAADKVGFFEIKLLRRLPSIVLIFFVRPPDHRGPMVFIGNIVLNYTAHKRSIVRNAAARGGNSNLRLCPVHGGGTAIMLFRVLISKHVE